MHRPTVGVIAVLLVALGAGALLWDNEALAGACLRIGAVMTLLWLAQPQLTRMPTWLWAVLGVGLVVLMRWPRLVLLLILAIPVLWILGPRSSQARRR